MMTITSGIKCLAGLRARVGLSGRTPRARGAAMASFSIALFCAAPAIAQCDCCEGNCGPGCDDAACMKLICAQDAFCCEVWWDGLCAAASMKQCEVCDAGNDCNKRCGADIAPAGSGDGHVDPADLGELLANWGKCGGCCADIHPVGARDGEVGPGDLAELLATWGSCVSCPSSNNDCCVGNDVPGCNQSLCCEAICATDAYCCQEVWDDLCAEAAVASGSCICEGGSVCGPANPNDCCVGGISPGCNDAACCEIVCAVDSFCCEVRWDPICAGTAVELCKVCGGGG